MIDKALEFAEYLAKDAEALIKAINNRSIMCGADGQEHDPDDIADAESQVAECIESLESSIYEFRKRSEK